MSSFPRKRERRESYERITPVKDRATILLVDDRPDKHVVYRAILDELGQNCVTAMSGEEALKQVLKHELAVILLDVNMPGMDGLETAALIRGRQRSAHVPIIFITADYGDDERTAKAYALGAVDFMVSPIVPEILRTKVKVFVDLYLFARQARRQVKERAAWAAERAARADAERAHQRSAFLAAASVALSRSLNFSATVRELVRVAIPFLADVAAVTLASGERGEAGTEVAWIEEAYPSPRIESLHSIECGWWREALERVIANGSGESYIARDAQLPEHSTGWAVLPGDLELSRGPKIDSLVILPLVAHGHTIGALSLGLRSNGRMFDSDQLTIASDVAGRAAIALDNALLYKEMREQDRRKNEFLAMLSHELRNPLAPITNAVHVLNTSAGDAQKMTWAKAVLERQVNQLRRLVDDLLDVSRITHGKIDLRLEPVDVAEVIAVAVETAQPLVDAQEHGLVVRPPPHPMRVNGDFARIAQILANLLNNAAKYTDKGGQISLEAAQEGDSVAFHIRDSGIGIPEEAKASIFEMFKQLGAASERPQGGLGVGLTLVKKLVHMHGGTIEARSEGHRKGSEFIVRLPLLHAATESAGGEGPVADEKREALLPKRRRILVADDNVDLATSMGLLLEMMGNDVRVTHDGMAAVSADSEFHPDVIFLDIGMAKMNGFDACRSIRGKPRDKQPIIIALTGWGQADDKRRSREAGFDHHLVKPIEPQALERFLAEIATQTA